MDFLKSIPPDILSFLLKLAMIAFTTLGVVYVFGRMLDLVKTDRAKNCVAVVTLILASFAVVVQLNHGGVTLLFEMPKAEIIEIILESLFYFTFSTVFYVLFAWRLWWRIDKLLDKRLGVDDTFTQTEKPKRKTPAKKK